MYDTVGKHFLFSGVVVGRTYVGLHASLISQDWASFEVKPSPTGITPFPCM